MPFTLSHPAAIALFRRLVRRGHLALSALAIGTMSPDFEYLWRLRPAWKWSHTWLGLFYFCLPVGLATLAVWVFFVRDPVRVLLALPNSKLALTPRWWLQAAGAIIIGALSHVVWDGFTHGYDWASALFPVLWSRVVVAGVSIRWFNVLQHLSTVFGGLVVLGWLARELAKGSPRALLLPWRIRVFAGGAALTAALGVWNATRWGRASDHWTPQVQLAHAAVGGLLGCGIAVLMYAAFHRSIVPSSEFVEPPA